MNSVTVIILGPSIVTTVLWLTSISNMLDLKWQEIVDKWDCGIDVSIVSDKDLNEYMESRILAYEDEEICDKDLWEVFKTEFKNFTTITISRISS